MTDGGGWGNVVGAVSEAAFMTGMERNGDVVTLGAYVSGQEGRDVLVEVVSERAARGSRTSLAWGTALLPPQLVLPRLLSLPRPCPLQAPLFVHWNNRPWPTNMIVIKNDE